MRWETQFCQNFQEYFANEGDIANILFSKPLRFATFEQASWKKIKSHQRFWERPNLSMYCKLQMVNLEAGHVASNAPKSRVHHHIVWLRHPGAPSKDIFYGKKEVSFWASIKIYEQKSWALTKIYFGAKKGLVITFASNKDIIEPQMKIYGRAKVRLTWGQKSPRKDLSRSSKVTLAPRAGERLSYLWPPLRIWCVISPLIKPLLLRSHNPSSNSHKMFLFKIWLFSDCPCPRTSVCHTQVWACV